MPDEDTKAPPALFEHCVNTYRAMEREAKVLVGSALVDVHDDEAEGALHPGNIVVYEGFFTQLVTGKLNLSVPYYTSITKALIEMGCIRQLKRGGGTSPSQWELIYEPTLELFTNSRPKKVKKQSKEAMYQEQIDTLNKRVGVLEVQVEDIVGALAAQYGTTKVEE